MAELKFNMQRFAAYVQAKSGEWEPVFLRDVSGNLPRYYQKRRISTMTDIETACRKIIDHYGIQVQKIKLMEELAELIQATAKSPDGLITDSMVEEMADVCIMVEQFRSTLSPDHDKFFYDMRAYKLRRQLMRMEG